MNTKICSKCEKELELDKFSFKQKAKGTRRADCKDCFSKLTKKHYSNNKSSYLEYGRRRREKAKEFICNYLSDKKCIDCDNSDIRVLEFDHIKTNKFSNIADMVRQAYSDNKILEEIKKCEIVCANCHRIRTSERSNNYKNKFYKEVWSNGISMPC